MLETIENDMSSQSEMKLKNALKRRGLLIYIQLYHKLQTLEKKLKTYAVLKLKDYFNWIYSSFNIKNK